MGLLTNIGRQRTGNADVDRALAIIQREFEQVYKRLDTPASTAAAPATTTVSTSTSPSGGGGGVSTLAGLSDVQLSSLASGDILQYGGTVWANTPIYSAAGFGEAVMRAFGDVNDDPTGWPDTATTDATISVDDSTRTVTITPTGASFYYYIHGVKVTISAAVSKTFSDVEGLHFFYLDSAGAMQENVGFDITLLKDKAYVCNLYWDAANNDTISLGDERHGHKMDWWTHRWIHLTQGAAYYDGFALTDITIGSGASDLDAQLGIQGGSFFDEDINHTHATRATPAQVYVYYRIGSNWRLKAVDNFPFVQPGSTPDYAGVDRPAYNLNTAGSFSLVEVTNNDFVLMHFFASNDAGRPFIAVVGQDEYATVALARAGAYTEINELILTGLPFEEFVPLGTAILECRNSLTNSVNARWVATDTGDDYIDFRQNPPRAGGSSGSGISTLNGLTATTQTFADVDDTNVTLAISSATATHTFTLGWTGTLAISRGGTGTSTAAAARVALLPALASNAGKVLAVNVGETDVEWVVGGAGSGITTLNTLTASTQTFAKVDDTNVTLTISSATSTHTFTVGWSGTLSVARGGTGSATAAAARVALLPSLTGNASKVLAVNVGETDVEWVTAGTGSGITSLGGLTAATQTFADVDDTNVTLAIASATSTHTFTIGWTGTLAVARGGTGSGTAAGARVNLLPTYTSNGGKVLALNSGATDVEWVTISSTAVSASRPAAAADGRIYFPTDGFGIERDGGSAWVKHGGYIRKMTAPLAASNWTWVNQGTATVTDYSNSLLLFETGRGTGTQERLLVRSAPATPWTFTVCFMAGSIWPKNYQGYGLCFRQSSDGKIHSFKQIWNTGNEWAWYSTKWNSATSFSADYVSAITFAPPPNMPHWMRITDNGTNRLTFFSMDGYNWNQLHTIGRTDFLTADQYGFQWTGEQTATPYRDIAVWVLSAELT